ncbi:MAG TPA: peptide chain release factor N(5)-glutamine methyltransferase [Pyrinomonadaceae bacterium]
MVVTIEQALREASETLERAGVPESRREASSLLAHVLQRDRGFLIAHSKDELRDELFGIFCEYIRRRATGEPSQYVTGIQDFYGRSFLVTPDVLIPRPETELLVDAAYNHLVNPTLPFSICDVGTGSGCIIITLLHQLQNARGIGVDVSQAAIAVAQENADAHKVTDRLTFTVSDCFNALPKHLSFDLIVSNPPYVSAAALPGLQREVRDYEPRVALSPGLDGLSMIRRLLEGAPGFLKDDGLLVMEIGFDQAEATETLIESKVWDLVEIVPDLAGIPRIVVLKKLPADES